MTHQLSDEELLKELVDRIDEKNRALFDLRMATKKLQEVNRRLVESEALKGHFLSNIRNEINNPLAVIAAIASEITSCVGRDPAECIALGDAIRSEAFSLDFQLRNIFCAAEIEAGEALPTPVKVDVHALVESTLSSFAPLAAKKRVELQALWEEEAGVAPLFVTDPAKLQLILANLLSNAVKFCSEGTTVRVGVRRDAGQLQLSVEDQGIGIDPADQGAIFERFHQLESGKAKGYPGHGLGLSIVKALAELLGGAVAVDSVVGRGSRFAALIPEAGCGEGGDVIADDGNEFFFDA